MNEVPVREFITRTVAVWIGLAVAFVGFACWLFAFLSAAIAFFSVEDSRDGLESFPIIAATLGALGTLGLAVGIRLVKGQPLRVPFTRRVLGVVLLLLAAIFLIVNRLHSDVPWWITAVLGTGGLVSLLTWKKKSDADE